jgi:hypothetical protein
MFSFTKTLVAIALGATVVAGVTMAATSMGGFQMSLSTAPLVSPWQGYSDGWDNAGWQCFSNGGRNVILLGLGFEKPAQHDWNSTSWAGCYDSWAQPFLSAGKTQHAADSFERRYVGIEVPTLTVIR